MTTPANEDLGPRGGGTEAKENTTTPKYNAAGGARQVRPIQDLFRGYEKAHGRYDVKRTSEKGKAEGKAITIREPVTQELWDTHLAGTGPGLGIIPLMEDNHIAWGGLDIDIYNLDHSALEKKIQDLDLPLVVCRTKSGGAHLYIFFKEPAPAEPARKIMKSWAAALGYGGCEIFPKQTSRADDDEEAIGNWLNMPYYWAEKTSRYAIKDGKMLSLEEFEAHAIASRVSLEDLVEVRPTQDLENLCEAVRVAKDGDRNNALNKAAFRLGQLIKAGVVDDEATASARLTKVAIDAGLSSREVKETVKSGIKGGKKKPLPKRLNPGVGLDDFYAYMPMHNYLYTPTRELWPAASVNSRLGSVPVGGDHIAASTWLDEHRAVEQMTWAPGQPMLIKNRLISEGGWIERNGVACFNLYRPPTIEPGDPTKADRWLDHAHKIYGDQAEHIIFFLAHRRQRPQEKINHAIVLAGLQGIGKDTILEPVKRAVGPWNFMEVSPKQTIGRFNAFLRSVILRVNEARDMGEINRYQFYEHMKAYTAAPPDVLRVDEKNLREYTILNCCGVIITTNHKTDGIYLPEDDRRHFVAWSDHTKEDFEKAYWNGLWGWYGNGGDRHVTAYLDKLNLESFDPKAPPPKTQAFWDIVDANRPQEEAELADAIDDLKQPPVFTLAMLQDSAQKGGGDFYLWITDRKNRRAIPHRLEKCGYVRVSNPDSEDGYWVVQGKRQAAYGRDSLTPGERVHAARALVRNPPRGVM